MSDARKRPRREGRFTCMFCCNHPDNGAFTGRMDAFEIDIGGDIALLVTGPAVRIDFSGRVGRLRGIDFADHRMWVGNWCWDAAILPRSDVARIAGYLNRRGWNCEEGSLEVAASWDDGTIEERIRNPRLRERSEIR